MKPRTEFMNGGSGNGRLVELMRVSRGTCVAGIAVALIARWTRRASLVWMLPRFLTDVLLSPDLAAAVARVCFVVYGMLIVGLFLVRPKPRLPLVQIVLCMALFLPIPILDLISLRASTGLLGAAAAIGDVTREPVVLGISFGPVTAPYTVADRESTWGAVADWQLVKRLSSDGPADPSLPYAVGCAEKVQCQLGQADLHGAERELATLEASDRSGMLWMLMKAKVLYTRGEIDKAQALAEETIRLDGDTEQSLSVSDLKATAESFSAYFGASVDAKRRDWAGTSSLLAEYWRLSHDPHLAERLESDSRFAEYVETSDYSTIRAQWR